MPEQHKSYIPASKKIPEMTVKAFILDGLVSIVLSAANAYLGLFAGLTVSAPLPSVNI